MNNLLDVLALWLPRATQKELMAIALAAATGHGSLPELSKIYVSITSGFTLISKGYLTKDTCEYPEHIDFSLDEVLLELAYFYANCYLVRSEYQLG